ncbi:hypothetical protein FFLO_05847 [Filobasidium floriforme]|uniref:P-loop containing nucleoside triphosphate hydrolase protein n=1 Tax=Filobasidium floriforme TaxID=5210 RepID=A0A8K0JG14_9TREE|nr:hypothetical protein FFLO_05847 [Filobasidium floriforme]
MRPPYPLSRRNRQDQPVRLCHFKNGIKKRKILLGILIPLALLCRVILLASKDLRGWPGMKGGGMDSMGWGWVRLGFLILSATIYLLYLHPRSNLTDHPTYHRHSKYITALFFLHTFILITYPMPTLLFVLKHRHRLPSRFDSDTNQAMFLTALRGLECVTLLTAWIAVGTMRRGPELYYDAQRLSIGFGWAMEDKKDVKGRVLGSISREDPVSKEPAPNVLDYYQCSILSLLFIGYIWSVAALAARRPELRPEDLPHMPETLRAENKQGDGGRGGSGAKRKVWTPWTLLREVCRGQGWLILSSAVFEWLYNASTFLPRYCMHQITLSFELPDRRADMTYAYLMAFGLFFGSFMGSNIRENIVNHKAIRVNLRTMLFHKILLIADDQSPDATGSGRAQILNLINVDVGVVASLAKRILTLSNAILMLGLSGGFLYSMFSWSALVAIATIPLMSPLSGFVARLTYKCDKALAEARDARIGAMRELLISVKVIKLNAWEEHHLRRISDLRAKEVRLQRWRYTIGTSFNILALMSPLVGIFAMFVSYTKLQGRSLTPASAFVATTVFTSIPEMMQRLLMSMVSLRRLCDFLNSDEIAHENVQLGSRISLENATVTWHSRGPVTGEASNREPFKLKDMNLRIPDEAKFVLVCGATGSGKTLFLLSLLGEARLLSGSITAPRSGPGTIPLSDEISHEDKGDGPDPEGWIEEDTVAYAAQIPYITHGTLRDMILFGLPFRTSRYETVVQQCGLTTDFSMLANGDQEEIGGNGVTLSGGQRARLSLARAVYSRAGTVLIDDVLSSLDATTSQYVYARCLRGNLLQKRRVVMVSHNVSLLLPAADLAIQLREGKIAHPGRPNDLREVLLKEEDQAVDEEFERMLPPDTDAEKPKSMVATTSSRRIYEEEHQERGNVQLSNYRFVIDSVGGKGYWAGLLFFVVAQEAFRIMTRFVVRRWTTEPLRNDHWIRIWSVVALMRVLTQSVWWFWLYGNGTGGFSQRGAAKMHNAMVDGILNAPLRYFDRTPEGRILNRFSNDIQKVDGLLPDSWGRTIKESLTVAVNVAILGISLPPVAIACAIAAYPFNMLRKFFGRMRASLARLDAVLASPISGLTYETLGSIVTIRAFGSSRFLCQLFATFEDIWVAFASAMLTMTSLVLGASGLFVLRSDMDAPMAGFILTFALDLSSQIFWLLDRVVDLEDHMVSVERIAEVAQIRPEATGEEGYTVPEDWPQTGEIVCQDLAARYGSDLPLVLQGVSFTAKPGERVCIVGRTGGGKSTMALCLLRDLSASCGSIKIDGIDIAKVPLHVLRSKISYIPQESLLTSGTLRDALDISGEKDDHELYAAMRRVHLDVGEGSPFSSLDTLVGLNFSLGERQLLVLARALLKSAKVIIMDEATSSIDYDTDAKVTKAIAEMKGVTVITIAHRSRLLIRNPPAVINYDRALVLKEGRILDNDSPAALIYKEESEFRKLCIADGPIEFQQLLAMITSGG